MRATTPSDGSIARRPRDIAEAASRYDLVLAVIPLALASGVILGATPTIPDSVGVGGGGVVALAATVYALFGDPPVEPRNGGGLPPLQGPGAD